MRRRRRRDHRRRERRVPMRAGLVPRRHRRRAIRVEREGGEKVGGQSQGPRGGRPAQSRAVAAGVRQGPDGRWRRRSRGRTVGTQGRTVGTQGRGRGRGRGRGDARGRRAESRASRIGPTRVRRSRPRRAQGVRHSLRLPARVRLGDRLYRRRRRFGRTGFREGEPRRRRRRGVGVGGDDVRAGDARAVGLGGSIPPPARGKRRTGRGRVDGALRSTPVQPRSTPFDSSGASRASRPPSRPRGPRRAPLERTSRRRRLRRRCSRGAF